MRYWVISHLSRGILTSESEPPLGIWKFQWSKPIGDDRNWKFGSPEEAQRVLERMPANLQAQSEIIKVGEMGM